LQNILQLYTISNDPVYKLADGTALFTAAIWMILAAYMLVNLIGYAIWYQKSRKAVNLGGACAESGGGYRRASYFMLGITVAMSAHFMASRRFGWVGIFGIANMSVIIALVLAIKNALKRAKVSRGVNISVTLISWRDFVLCFDRRNGLGHCPGCECRLV
jgi:hypothetical protein